MSGVLGNLGKKITTTLDTAQKDLRQSVAKTLSVAATSIANAPATTTPRAPGAKSKLFTTILERSRHVRDTITHRCKAGAERQGPSSISTQGGGVERDEVQEKLALFARLEKEFADLIDAYEILLVERIHLEEIITVDSQLESLDDLELVGQYYKSLQDTSQISRQEIVRLTEKVEELESMAKAKQGQGQQPEQGQGQEQEQERDQEREQKQDHGQGRKVSKALIEQQDEKDNVITAPSDNLESVADESIAVKLGELQSLIGEKDGVIFDLEERCESLRQEKSILVMKQQERSEQIMSLESQKMALETKVGYMQRQLQDLESLKSKLRELTSTNMTEAEGTKDEMEKSQRRINLLEAELARMRRELEACKTELALIKREGSQTSNQLLLENTRLEAILLHTQHLLKEEEARCILLERRLDELNIELQRAQDALAKKEAEMFRQRRALSSDVSLQSSLLGRNEGSRGERVGTVEEDELSMRSTPDRSGEHLPNGTESRVSAGPRRRSLNGEETALKAIRAECERLALENSRLKNVSQNEYLRNIIVRFLQLPEQRSVLIPVLANLLRLSESELASVRK